MRIAVITHAFPPSNHANGKRPYYLVRAFLDAGWEVDVYTSALGCEKGVIEPIAHPGLNIHRQVDLVVNGFQKLKRFNTLHRAVVSLVAAFVWPDFYALWSRRVIKRIIKAKPYDRVVCFVFPPSVYLAAKKNGLIDHTWVFDLQESVTPQYALAPRRSPLQKRRLPELKKLEKRALSQAGKVVYTAETNRRAYIEQGLVTDQKTEHIPYFYDAPVFDLAKQHISELFEIRYFGTFDWSGSRSPKVFLTSLADFLKKYPDARTKTRFSFYGTWLAEHDGLIKDLGLEDVVQIQAAVPYEKYLDLVMNAPVLLLVIAAEHNLFMPSKIVDYFGAARPILAYVPRESEMRSVLEEAGMAGQAMDETDVTSGVKALESLWHTYCAGSFDSVDANTGYWSSAVQVPRYVALLKDLPEAPEA